MDTAINIWQEDKLTELVLSHGNENETVAAVKLMIIRDDRLYGKMDRYNLDKGGKLRAEERNELSGGMKRKTSKRGSQNQEGGYQGERNSWVIHPPVSC